MGEVRPTCCEKASKSEAVTWCQPSEWGDDEVDRAAGWGAVVDWEWWGRSAEEAEPVFGHVDFCPFCGVRLPPTPSGTPIG
jgi:hypothetical protein